MKKAILILLSFLIVIAAGYISYRGFWNELNDKSKQLLQSLNPTPSPKQTVPVKTYSDTDMNLSFNYPENLQITTVRSHLISIKDPSSSEADNSLYIFETSVPTKTKTIDIPFVMKSKLTSQTTIPIHNFSAKQLVYSDGTTYITLQKNQQFIMLRIPKDSKGLDDTVTDFVNTIKFIQ